MTGHPLVVDGGMSALVTTGSGEASFGKEGIRWQASWTARWPW